MDAIQFGLEHSKVALRATVECEASFSPLHGNIQDDASYKSQWIQHGRSLTVDISFSFRDCSTQHEQEFRHAVGELQEALQSASLWDQLGLECVPALDWPITTGEDGILSDNPNVLRAVFQPICRTAAPGRPAARLLNGTSFKDVKPPPGSRIRTMQGIKIRMDLTTIRKSSAKEARKTSVYQDDNVEDDEMLDEAFLPGANLEPLPDLQSPSTIAVNDKAASTSLQSSHRSFPTADVLLGFLDAAIRGSIHARPTNLMPGLKMSSRNEAPRLSATAPAIWSPNHLPALAERACYIPTLSSALSSYLGRGASMKAQRLKGRLVNIDIDADADATSTRHKAVKDSCEILLWKNMSSALHDTKRARTLKPIGRGARYSKRSRLIEDEMLLEEIVFSDPGQRYICATPPLFTAYEEDMLDEDELLGAEDDMLVDSQDSGYWSGVGHNAWDSAAAGDFEGEESDEELCF